MTGRSTSRRRTFLPAAARAFAFAASVLLLCAANAEAEDSPGREMGSPAGVTAAPVEDLFVLQCTVVDASSGSSLFARGRITDQAGFIRIPNSGAFYFSLYKGYFCTSGAFSVHVPAGRNIVRVGQGFEYAEVVDTLDVQSDTSIVLRLERRFRMSDFGWYSGDTHVHTDHPGGFYPLAPPTVLLLARAEGINVVNCLDNAFYFTGGPASCSTPDCIIYMSEEYRSNSLGHLGLLGLRSLVLPLSSGWWPVLADVADSAHARPGALVISAHPVTTENFSQIEAWPGSGLARELPLDVIAGRVDAVDVMSYSNLRPGGKELGLWYRLLNCGFKLPATAGTDACVNRNDSYPLGGYRTFVLVPPAGFTFSAWIENLARGRTYVSNGPLITHFDLDGLMPGDSLALPIGGTRAVGTASVRSVYPLSTIEVVQNGIPVETIHLADSNSMSIDTTFSVPLVESCWVALRVTGRKSGWLTTGDSLFAHTSPIYFTLRGKRIAKETDAEYLMAWIDNLKSLAVAKGQWPDTLSSARFFEQCDNARAFYDNLAHGTVADADRGVSDRDFPPLAIRCENAPNPFSESTSITITVPGGVFGAPGRAVPVRARTIRLAVYDVQGRLVRRLVEEPVGAGTYAVLWNGKDGRGRRLASGIYFAKVSVAEQTFSHKMLLIR